MKSIIATGPQMKTSRSAMSGTSSLQMRRREQIAAPRARVVADDVVDLRAALLGDLVELVREDDVLVGDDAVERDDVAVHLLEQRAHRRDPDPACDQERLVDACGCPR